MLEWLDRAIPQGPVHAWLVDLANAGLKALFTLVLFLVVRWLALRAISGLMFPLLARAQREGESSLGRLQTLEGITRSAVTYTLLFLALVTLVSQLGVNVTALLTGAGVAGLALSFGAQRLVRDVLTGFFMLLEDQLRVGEVVTLVGGPGLPQLSGTVLEMGLRVSRLKDISGKLVVIGNGDIVAVVNHSRGPITATVELGVAADASLAQAGDLVAAIELPDGMFSGQAVVEGVSSIEPERMVLRIAAPAQPGKAPEAELALRRAAGEALRAGGIEIR